MITGLNYYIYRTEISEPCRQTDLGVADLEVVLIEIEAVKEVADVSA